MYLNKLYKQAGSEPKGPALAIRKSKINKPPQERKVFLGRVLDTLLPPACLRCPLRPGDLVLQLMGQMSGGGQAAPTSSLSQQLLLHAMTLELRILLRRSALSSWVSPACLTLQVISWVRKTTRMLMKEAH